MDGGMEYWNEYLKARIFRTTQLAAKLIVYSQLNLCIIELHTVLIKPGCLAEYQEDNLKDPIALYCGMYMYVQMLFKLIKQIKQCDKIDRIQIVHCSLSVFSSPTYVSTV